MEKEPDRAGYGDGIMCKRCGALIFLSLLRHARIKFATDAAELNSDPVEDLCSNRLSMQKDLIIYVLQCSTI